MIVSSLRLRGNSELPAYTYDHDVYGENRDIWILSMPAFRWVQTDATSTPRFDHKCHRSRDQMFSIGGNVFPLWKEVDKIERGLASST
jgi:hypothetical protein